LSEGKSMTEKT